jgi:hypothetical protein
MYWTSSKSDRHGSDERRYSPPFAKRTLINVKNHQEP